MAKRNFLLSNSTYKQDEKRNNMLKPCFHRVIQQLESIYKNYWLSSGTLLGNVNKSSIL